MMMSGSKQLFGLSTCISSLWVRRAYTTTGAFLGGIRYRLIHTVTTLVRAKVECLMTVPVVICLWHCFTAVRL